MKKYIAIFLSIAASLPVVAQHTINGRVVGIDGTIEKGLPFAYLQWVNSTNGTYADSAGYFTLQHKGESPQLVVNYLGYKTDTFLIEDMSQFITLKLVANEMLGVINIELQRVTYGLKSREPQFTVNLDEREFQKAACCNLSESFENAPAIDVSIGDAVTGTKQIKMLGLDGFYTLISREYMPSIRSLNSYYGMSFIPAAWVESIQITKGAGSIVNGYESIAGQINVELKKPFDKEKFMLDQFFSQAGRSETDMLYRFDLNKYVSTSIFGHYAYYPGMNDNNNDGFMDMPSGMAYSFLNRWQFTSENGLEGQLNIFANNDDKISGQIDYFKENNTNLYGVTLLNRNLDITAKLGKSFKDKPYKSFGSQYMYSIAQHNSMFGSETNQRNYSAEAKNAFVNLMYQSIFGNTFHSFQTGLSFLGDELTETLDTFTFDRQEYAAGIFMEYTYKPSDDLTVVTGLRADYNNLYGALLTPRIHTRYRFNEDKTSVRASAGLGRHTSNIIAQNQYLLASQRRIHIIESNTDGAYGLDQEVAFNAGVSLEHKFKFNLRNASFIADFFHTSFINEVVVDRETPGEVFFYNMENGTKSNSLQLQLDLNPYRRTEFRLAYRMFDVSSRYLLMSDEDLQKPFVSKHRAFVNLTQKTRNKWQGSATLHWSGPQRIAGHFKRDQFEEIMYVSDYSESFFTLNLQISKQFTKYPLELYLGAENLFNYQQPDPIVNVQDPFDSKFDAGMVWGPIFGRMIYGGFRYRLNLSYNDKIKAKNQTGQIDDTSHDH